jgi:hypothetical protein
VRIITTYSVQKAPATAAVTRRSSLRLAEIAGAETAAALTTMEQMQQQMQNLATENARLAGLVESLMRHQHLPPEQVERICNAPLASSEIVEWLPPHNQRRSKKTPLQLACRTPLRPPPGTPQTQKKSKMSTSPSTNRFDALADNLDDVEMDEETEATLAAVEERIDNLKSATHMSRRTPSTRRMEPVVQNDQPWEQSGSGTSVAGRGGHRVHCLNVNGKESNVEAEDVI